MGNDLLHQIGDLFELLGHAFFSPLQLGLDKVTVVFFKVVQTAQGPLDVRLL